MDAATFDAIIADVAAGAPVRKLIVEHGISGRQFYGHLNASAQAAERYARAKEAALEAMADEMLDIADDVERDTYEDGEGAVRIAPDVVNRARLRVDTRKWIMSKLAPKKYGDKLDVDHKGGFVVTLHSALASV
jgi:hypothetical protein